MQWQMVHQTILPISGSWGERSAFRRMYILLSYGKRFTGITQIPIQLEFTSIPNECDTEIYSAKMSEDKNNNKWKLDRKSVNDRRPKVK